MMPRPEKPAATVPGLVAVYLAFVVLCAAVSGLGFSLVLVAELVVAAWLVTTGRLGPRGLRALAVFSLVRFGVAAVLALFAHPVSAVFGGQTWRQLASLVTPRLIVAAGEVLWSMTPAAVLFAVLLVVAIALQSQRKGGWQGFLAAAAVVPLMSFVEPIEANTRPDVDRHSLVQMAGVGAFDLNPVTVSARRRPESLPPEGAVNRVVLVMLESVGATNLRDHLERHPDGPFARLLSRGLYYERVLSVANASHMAQPATLTSQEFSRGVSVGNAALPTVHAPGWGFAEHFAAKQWRTVMQSSQDETWMRMHEITMGEAWSVARHARDEEAHEARYSDACGTGKVLDSVTLQRFQALLASERGPLFGYMNLQNTHYSYVVEADAPRAMLSELKCVNQHVMPAWRLLLARGQYARSLDESLERLAALVEAHPDTLFVVTGDHGESMLPGEHYGHAHRAIPEQMETFGLFVGPGIEPRRETRSISSLDLLPTTIALVSPGDLEALPRDLLQGIDARTYGDRRRVQLSVSYGMQPTSYAVDVDGVWMQVTADEIRCRDRAGQALDVSRCQLNREALAYWLSCKTAFYAQEDHARFLEPCWRLTREKFSDTPVAHAE